MALFRKDNETNVMQQEESTGGFEEIFGDSVPDPSSAEEEREAAELAEEELYAEDGSDDESDDGSGDADIFPADDDEDDGDHVSPWSGRDRRRLAGEKVFDRSFGAVYWLMFAAGIFALAYPFICRYTGKMEFRPELYYKLTLFLPGISGFLAALTAGFGPFKGFMTILFSAGFAFLNAWMKQEDPWNVLSYFSEILENAAPLFRCTVIGVFAGAVIGYLITLIFNGRKHGRLEVSSMDRKSAFCAFSFMLLLGFSLYWLITADMHWQVYAIGFGSVILLFCLSHAVREGFSVGTWAACGLLYTGCLLAGWWFLMKETTGFREFVLDHKAAYYLGAALILYLAAEFIGGIIYDGAAAVIGLLWLGAVAALALPFFWDSLPFAAGSDRLVCLIVCAALLGVTMLLANIVNGFSFGRVLVGLILGALYIVAEWLRQVMDAEKGTLYYFTSQEAVTYYIILGSVLVGVNLVGGLIHAAVSRRRGADETE